MKQLIAVVKQGPEVLEKEANKWWGGINSIESKLGYPASELLKLFWMNTEFEIEMEEEDLKKYKREEIEIALIFQGKLIPEKITCYKSGNRRFITKNDYENLIKSLEV